MTRLPLEFGARAVAEAKAAAQWYERERVDLRDDFLAEVEQTLERISESPLRYPVLEGDTRRALLDRFPYAIFFRLKKESIRVIAVFHSARDPKRWRRRR
jgi:toxin ParE1/3/4